MDKIRMYGEVEEIPERPTWEDVKRRARTNPLLYQAVTMVEHGGMSKEEALIRIALAGANYMVQSSDQIIDLLNTKPFSVFVPAALPPDPEYK